MHSHDVHTRERDSFSLSAESLMTSAYMYCNSCFPSRRAGFIRDPPDNFDQSIDQPLLETVDAMIGPQASLPIAAPARMLCIMCGGSMEGNGALLGFSEDPYRVSIFGPVHLNLPAFNSD